MSDRGTGRTTRQIREASQNAYFVVPNSTMVEYAHRLSRKINRDDITVKSAGAMRPDFSQLSGIGGFEIVVDHATWDHLTIKEADKLRDIVLWNNRKLRR